MQEVAGVTSSNDRLGPTRVACGVIFAMRANMPVASAVAAAAEVGVSGKKKVTHQEATSLVAWSITSSANCWKQPRTSSQWPLPAWGWYSARIFSDATERRLSGAELIEGI